MRGTAPRVFAEEGIVRCHPGAAWPNLCVVCGATTGNDRVVVHVRDPLFAGRTFRSDWSAFVRNADIGALNRLEIALCATHRASHERRPLLVGGLLGGFGVGLVGCVWWFSGNISQTFMLAAMLGVGLFQLLYFYGEPAGLTVIRHDARGLLLHAGAGFVNKLPRG